MRGLRWVAHLWIGVLILNLLLSTLLVGGRFVIPMVSELPGLADADPSDGAQDVAVRTLISLRFSTPMNPRTTERSLQIEPSLPAELTWDTGFTTLTISPTTRLAAATDYYVHVSTAALSRYLRPLEQPIDHRFRTIAAPAVLETQPADGATEIDAVAPVLVRFSRPMVGEDQLLRRQPAPPASTLQVEPSAPGQLIWVDSQTLLFQPDRPWLPGQRYRVSLPGDLTDRSGSPLGQSTAWSFTTAFPTVLEHTPTAGARNVAPGTPISLTLAQPLSAEQLAVALTISPTMQLQLAQTNLPDGTQVVTVTPQPGWQTGRLYEAELALGAQSVRWSFEAAPRPQLIGRFPGEGQILPIGQEIRLIFSTPVDAAKLRDALQFDPPATNVQTSGSGTEVRVAAALRVATPYTMTIPSDLTDQSGVPFGISYPIRFTTAPAAPAMALPEEPDRLMTIAPQAPAALLVRRTNVSTILADLYDLDEATLVRTLVFDDEGWRQFEPERYQQTLRRTWTIPLSDTLNAAVEDRLPITEADGTPLQPGVYYLRLRTPEGPRADLVLIVSDTRLALQVSEASGLIWATDALSGTVIANLPVALYQDDSLILEGTTDSNGLLTFNLASGIPHRYAALVRSNQPALAAAGPIRPVSAGQPALYRLFLTANGAVYHPGDHIQLAGIVRQMAGDAPTIPLQEQRALVRLFNSDGRAAAELQAPLGPTGVLSASIQLASALPLGSYRLQVDLGSASESLPLQIVRPSEAAIELEVFLPSPPGISAPARSMIVAETAGGLPAANTPITWTLSARTLAPPLPEGFESGAGAFAPPVSRSGSGATDQSGRYMLTISETIGLANIPLGYRLEAQHGTAHGAVDFTVDAADIYLGVRLPKRVVPGGEAAAVELLAVDAAGQPLDGVALTVQLLRADRAGDRPVATRRVTTGSNGLAETDLPVVGGGSYLVQASGTDQEGRAVQASAMLWGAGPSTVVGDLQIVPDQQRYTPGETAALLVTLPAERDLLLTHQRGGVLVPEVRRVRPGVPITMTMTATDVPATRVSIYLPPRAGELPGSATRMIEVDSPVEQPQISLAADRQRYLPGSTAAITVVVAASDGTPLPADVVVAVFADTPPSTAGITLTGDGPADLVASFMAPAQAEPERMDTAALPAVYWSGPLRIDGGAQQISFPLPQRSGRYTVVAWAASEQAIGYVSTELLVEAPLRVQFDLPPFLRSGEPIELAAYVLNTSAATQTVRLSLTAQGLSAASGGFPAQTRTLAPFEVSIIRWSGTANETSSALARLIAEGDWGVREISGELPLLVAPPSVLFAGGAVIAQSLGVTVPISPSAQSLIVDFALTPEALAAQVARDLEMRDLLSTIDQAGLLLVSAQLTETATVARQSIEQLAQSQNTDGGWGWWPSMPSQPLVTAAVLEAFAKAEKRGLNVPIRSRESALNWARAAAADPLVELDRRAQLAYALTLFDQDQADVLQDLSTALPALNAEGAAYISLALPAQASLQPAIMRRLELLAQIQGGRTSWLPTDDGQPGGELASTALAIEALLHGGGDVLLRESSLATLLQIPWGAEESNGYALARAISALRADWPVWSGTTRYTVELNGEKLIEQTSSVLTTTQQLELPGGRLRASSALTVTTSQNPLLLSYYVTGPPAEAQPVDGVTVRTELFDQDQQTLLLPGTVPPGQRVVVRLTVLVNRPVHYALLHIPLPPGAVFYASASSGPLHPVAQLRDQALYAADRLEPGVYVLRYELQPRYGSAEAPAPFIQPIPSYHK